MVSYFSIAVINADAISWPCIIRVSYFPDDGYEIVPKHSRHPEKNVRGDQSREYLVRLNMDWILCSIVDSIAPFVERQPLSTVRRICEFKSRLSQLTVFL